MKTVAFCILLLVSANLSVKAQDTCGYFSQRNPRGMMMNITGPVYCDDSLLFTCVSSRHLPFQCGMMDSIGYDVCLHADDGQWHLTTIFCGTSEGTITKLVSLLAPGSAPAGVSTLETVPTISLTCWPNPVTSTLHIDMTNSSGMATQCEIVNQDGAIVRNVSIHPGEMALDLSNLASGAYMLRLLSSNSIVLTRSFVISR